MDKLSHSLIKCYFNRRLVSVINAYIGRCEEGENQQVVAKCIDCVLVQASAYEVASLLTNYHVLSAVQYSKHPIQYTVYSFTTSDF